VISIACRACRATPADVDPLEIVLAERADDER
jgi:hypothetical protein